MEKTIRVLYDYQTFHAQRFGGISRYFCEIAGHACHTTPEIAVGFSPMNQYIRHSDIKGHTSIPMRPYKIMSGWFRDINRKASIKAIRKGRLRPLPPHILQPLLPRSVAGQALRAHHTRHDTQAFPAILPQRPHPFIQETAGSEGETHHCHKRMHEEGHHGIPQRTRRKIDVIYHGLDPQPLAEGRQTDFPTNTYCMWATAEATRTSNWW